MEVVAEFLHISRTHLCDHGFIYYFVVVLISDQGIIEAWLDTYYVRWDHDKQFLELVRVLISDLLVMVSVLGT